MAREREFLEAFKLMQLGNEFNKPAAFKQGQFPTMLRAGELQEKRDQRLMQDQVDRYNQRFRDIESGSLEKNASDLATLNGTTRMDTGEISQGAQELAQKVDQNKKTGIMQRVAGFLNKMNPFDNLFPDNRVDYLNPDGSTQKVNPDFLKLIMNRPDLKERFDRTGSIYSDMP